MEGEWEEEEGDGSPLDSLVESFRKNGSVFLSSLSVSEEPHRCRSAASHPPPHGSAAAGSALFGSATASPSHLHYYHHHQHHQQHQQQQLLLLQGQASPNSSSCFESCDGGDVGFDSDNGERTNQQRRGRRLSVYVDSKLLRRPGREELLHSVKNAKRTRS
ncbi:hypothetical protein HPB47_023039 [Ixodes persulcatus]|uniref:Uncharacterized protein n=1 Tax=Ixodes persulcatus TaxID=34615 RepID=A0AC60Q987_IXOPE|nr:hypothetical protein HPB47_023039 [Ixodes persulcatus]